MAYFKWKLVDTVLKLLEIVFPYRNQLILQARSRLEVKIKKLGLGSGLKNQAWARLGPKKNRLNPALVLHSMFKYLII